MRNPLWLTRGAWALTTAIAAVSALSLPASAQASAHPKGSQPKSAQSKGAHPSGSATPASGPAGEWWLNSLSAQQEWSAAPQEGSGITVAVLSTGVDPNQQDLTGNVAPGPDFTGLSADKGAQYRGGEGTAIASLIAGHGHADGSQGITGIAPKARILSVRVTVGPKDQALGQPGAVQELPGAIARGINYAVSHGATVVDLPSDPAVLASTEKGGTIGGGNVAEQSAVSNAIAHNVVLVAPAGDNGSAQMTNYPAAYPGVVSAGATDQSGNLASFSSIGSYVSLTAPGEDITAAKPGSGDTTLSSTDASSALTAGIAALVRSRYPQLSATQVDRALKSGSAPVTGQRPGTGAGAVNAVTAVTSAASITSLIGTPTPKLVSHLPEEAAIGGGALVIVILAIVGVVRWRRRDPDDDIPDWGDGLSGASSSHPANPEDPFAQADPPATQRGPGSPGRRASAADAVGRTAGLRLPPDGPPPPGYGQDQGYGQGLNPNQFPGGMPSQGPNPISGPMRAASPADPPLPRRSKKRAAHRR